MKRKWIICHGQCKCVFWTEYHAGDLAGAVNRLETATDYAEARITGKEGK